MWYLRMKKIKCNAYLVSIVDAGELVIWHQGISGNSSSFPVAVFTNMEYI